MDFQVPVFFGDYDSFLRYVAQKVCEEKKVSKLRDAAKSILRSSENFDLKTPTEILKLASVGPEISALKNILDKTGLNYFKLKLAWEKSTGKTDFPLLPPKSEGKRLCSHHDEDCEFNCKQCKQLICKKCTEKEHFRHEWVIWKPSEYKEDALKLLMDLSSKNEEIIRELNTIQTTDNSRKDELIADIKKTKDEKLAKVEKDCVHLINECGNIYDERKSITNGEIKFFQDTNKRLQSLRSCLQSGTDLDNSIEETLSIVQDVDVRREKAKIVFEDMSEKELIFSQKSHKENMLGNITSDRPDLQDRPDRPRSSKTRAATQKTYGKKPNYQDDSISGWQYRNEFKIRQAYIATMHASVDKNVWCRLHHSSDIILLSTEGEQVKLFDTKQKSTGDFCILQDQVIYCDYNKKAIYSLFHDKNPQKLHESTTIPLGICLVRVESGYDVYVGMTDDHGYRVNENSSRSVRYFTLKKNSLTDTKKVFDVFGTTKEKIFTYPYRLTYNKENNSLCVIDRSSLSSGRLIILHRMNIGTIIGTYEGSKALVNAFDPRGCCCDSRGQVIITDTSNNAVHILDARGVFRRLLITPDHELDKPRSVSIAGGLLWIGCENGKVVAFIEKP